MPIVDHEFCGDMGESGATCFHTLKADTRDIEKQQWDIERMGQICEKSEVFADWKSVIEKLCSDSKKCTYEQKEAINRFFLHIDGIKNYFNEK